MFFKSNKHGPDFNSMHQLETMPSDLSRSISGEEFISGKFLCFVRYVGGVIRMVLYTAAFCRIENPVIPTKLDLEFLHTLRFPPIDIIK